MTRKIAKLSIPGLADDASLDQYLDYSNPLFNEWEIHLNNPNLKTADAWFVVEDVNLKDNECFIDKRNIYFLAAETAQNLGHIEDSQTMKNFLNQFYEVFTYHQYFGSNVTSVPPFLPWMINSNHGTSIFKPHYRNVEYFDQLESLEKPKLLSVICSTQSLTPAHKLRLNFVRNLKSHFGSELDWYGNGVNSIKEKWDALAPYKFTIALENQSRHNVITEKLGDSFLALSYPIYWGAPNAGDFFDANGYTTINIEDHTQTIRRIEEVLKSNYTEKLPHLIENKKCVIHEFNFLIRILKICASKPRGDKLEKITLHPASVFQPIARKTQNIIKKSVLSRVERFDSKAETNLLEIVKTFYILFRYNKITKRLIGFFVR